MIYPRLVKFHHGIVDVSVVRLKKIKSRQNGDGVQEAEPMEPMKINDDTKRQELKDMISKLNR